MKSWKPGFGDSGMNMIWRQQVELFSINIFDGGFSVAHAVFWDIKCRSIKESQVPPSLILLKLPFSLLPLYGPPGLYFIANGQIFLSYFSSPERAKQISMGQKTLKYQQIKSQSPEKAKFYF